MASISPRSLKPRMTKRPAPGLYSRGLILLNPKKNANATYTSKQQTGAYNQTTKHLLHRNACHLMHVHQRNHSTQCK